MRRIRLPIPLTIVTNQIANLVAQQIQPNISALDNLAAERILRHSQRKTRRLKQLVVSRYYLHAARIYLAVNLFEQPKKICRTRHLHRISRRTPYTYPRHVELIRPICHKLIQRPHRQFHLTRLIRLLRKIKLPRLVHHKFFVAILRKRYPRKIRHNAPLQLQLVYLTQYTIHLPLLNFICRK